MKNTLLIILIFLLINCSTKTDNEQLGFIDLIDNGENNHDPVKARLYYSDDQNNVNGFFNINCDNQSYRFFLDSNELIKIPNTGSQHNYGFNLNSINDYPIGKHTIFIAEDNLIKGKINIEFPDISNISASILDTAWRGDSKVIEEIPVRFKSKINSDYNLTVEFTTNSYSCTLDSHGNKTCSGNSIDLHGEYNGIDSIYVTNLPNYTQRFGALIRNDLKKSFANFELEIEILSQKYQMYRDQIR